ncbi:MAG: type I-C CRISPR-associated endonuclease Cas1c [Bacillota bacterium]
MRKMLNVLYITNPEAYLNKDGDNVVVRIDGKEIFRTPIHYLEGIVTFGHTGTSPALLGLCIEKGINVSLLSPYGKHLANVTGAPKGNVLLRRKQYRLADNDQESAHIAKSFIIGKLGGCRTVLRRFISDYNHNSNIKPLDMACKSLNRNIEKVEASKSLEELRGIEGESARSYFSVFDKLLLCQKDCFYMNERSRRPPKDNINALLSLLYTLLLHETKAALITVGLDPYVGYLHRDKPGRMGLALDLMEEFRPYLADRLVLSMINRQQLTGSDFISKESGGVFLKEKPRKSVLNAWQNRKAEETTHPFLGEKIPLGLLPYAQALLLARFLRGDIERYPPFIWN